MKSQKRIFLYVLALLCTLTLIVGLCSCDNKPQQPDTPDDPPEEVIDIVTADKTTVYTIIRSDFLQSTDIAAKAAASLRKSIAETYGCDIQIDTDFYRGDEAKAKAEAAYEILIGTTNRAANETIPADLARDEFFISVADNKIIIAAAGELGYNKALEYFLNTYVGYSKDAVISVPKTLNLRQKFEFPDVVYIMSDIQNLGGKDTGTANWNDIARLMTSLQGRLNKNAKENGFWMYWNHDSQDGFWLNYISGEGKLLDGLVQERITKWDEFWQAFGSYIKEAGMVVWDPDVPSTSNVAATICAVEGYLPVCFSTKDTSLYQWLKANDVPIKINLNAKFAGFGTIPDTDIESTGSAKCDAYIWALEKYMDRCSSTMIAYVLDGASTIPGNHIYDTASSHDPSWNQLYSHDYYIYNECFFMDLTCVADEIPCDDPDQPMGTDARTLRLILSTMQERNNGKMTKLMGFPPWYMKYTTTNGHGKTEPVTLEWNFVDVLSSYNCVKEADAAHPAWMTNASVYTQYERSKTKYTNNKQTDDTLTFNPKTRYFTIYMGDYDSSAWLKNLIPSFFNDSARGEYPLMWGFNPNLSDRVPMIFDYIYENLTVNDYIVTGDSGAGYVAPSMLADIDAWVEFNEPYMEMYDLDIVGFIINTTHPVDKNVFEAYAEISPVGAFHNTGSKRLTIYNDETVFMHLQNGIDPNSGSAKTEMYNYMQTPVTNFAAFRTVVQSPTSVVNCIDTFLQFANGKHDGYTYVCVDPYTLFELALESGMGDHVYGN